MVANFITWRFWCWSTSFAIWATGDKCHNSMCWYFEGWFQQLTTTTTSSSSGSNNNNPFLKDKRTTATTTTTKTRNNYMATRQQHNITRQWHVFLDLVRKCSLQLQELWLWFSKPSSTLLHPWSSQWYWRWAHLAETWPLDSEGMRFCPQTVHTYTVSLASCTTVCLQERDPLCSAVMDVLLHCFQHCFHSNLLGRHVGSHHWIFS